MPDPIDAIRSAIERGDFNRAHGLWMQWSTQLAQRAQAGEGVTPEWRRTRDLFGWARNVILAERAQLLSQLNRTHVAGAYANACESAPSRIVQSRF